LKRYTAQHSGPTQESSNHQIIETPRREQTQISRPICDVIHHRLPVVGHL